MVRRIPFRIDRTRPRALVRQMTDGLRDAIVTGYYKPGDTLPTIGEWTRALDVSIRVPEGALANLVKEGYVVTRPRQGCMVMPQRGRRVWLGHVLLVRPVNAYSHYVGEQIAAVEEQLSKAGYLATTIVVREQGSSFDFAQLDSEMKRNVNLAIVFGEQAPILRHVAEAGLPYVYFPTRIATDEPRGCVGRVPFHLGGALSEFVAHCVRAGVRRVVVVCKAEFVNPCIAALEGAGISVEQVAVEAEFGQERVENLERETCRAIDGLFASRGRSWLPDLIYSVDDYQTIGLLLSLLGHGVKIPEDVRFVTFKNRGHGPAMSKSLACIQYDPVAMGRAAGIATVRYLEGGEFKLDGEGILIKYLPGDTFKEDNQQEA